jgi:N utilization substance protein B
MNPIARRYARQYALQGLYQWQISHTLPADIEAQFLVYQQMSKKTDLVYFKDLLHQVPLLSHEIDDFISPHIRRPLDEIDPIELTILRISVYELKNRLDIPYRVVINEALELTKKFGSIEGYKFVNGVLDQVARQLRTIEINAEKN